MIETEILDQLYLEIAQFTSARNFREVSARLFIEEAKQKLTSGINLLDVLRLLEKVIDILKAPSPLS